MTVRVVRPSTNLANGFSPVALRAQRRAIRPEEGEGERATGDNKTIKAVVKKTPWTAAVSPLSFSQ